MVSAVSKGGSLHARLKAETARLHARTEEIVPLLRPDLDRTGYAKYLARFLGFVRPIEARLEDLRHAFAAHGLELEDRIKAPRIVADLVALGWEPRAIEALPSCTDLPKMPTLGEAWGAFYVLEGSTLGGVTLHRVLAPRLGLSHERGLSFLWGHGERTGVAWKSFIAALDRFEANGGDPDAVTSGARDTFGALIRWLAEDPRLG